jgi:hypothetical protein
LRPVRRKLDMAGRKTDGYEKEDGVQCGLLYERC